MVTYCIIFVVFGLLVTAAFAPPFLFFPASADLARNHPLSLWKMDELSGNRIDSVGSITLTNGGAEVSGAAGVISNAAVDLAPALGRGLLNGDMGPPFTNGPAYLELTNKSWTVSMWVWPFSDGMGSDPPYALFGKWNSGVSQEYALVMAADGKVSAWSVGDDGMGSPMTYTVTSTNAATMNAWNFVVATYSLSAQTLSVSLNGTPYTTTTGVPSNWSSKTEINFGSINDATYVGFNSGKIDQSGIWNAAWSQADVTWMYNGGLGRVLAGSTGHWRFE